MATDSTSASRDPARPSSSTPELFGGVYARGPVAAAVDDRAWLQAMLDVEAAIARAGVIPEAAAQAIAAACDAKNFDIAAIGREAAESATPVVPLVRAHVDRAIARTTDFTAPFQDYITRCAWGGVWTRDGLDRRTRSCITLAVLTALGREHEIAMHVRAARNNGLSPEEIAEVLLHTAVYAGVPAANAAFAIAQEVLDGEVGEG